MHADNAHGAVAAVPAQTSAPRLLPTREQYRRSLPTVLNFWAVMRVLCYAQTLGLLLAAKDIHGQSLLAWVTWLGSAAALSGWLYENNGRRVDLAVVVNLVNVALCAAIVVLLVWHRF